MRVYSEFVFFSFNVCYGWTERDGPYNWMGRVVLFELDENVAGVVVADANENVKDDGDDDADLGDGQGYGESTQTQSGLGDVDCELERQKPAKGIPERRTDRVHWPPSCGRWEFEWRSEYCPC